MEKTKLSSLSLADLIALYRLEMDEIDSDDESNVTTASYDDNLNLFAEIRRRIESIDFEK